MPIDFHATQNRYSYATRDADSGWADAITALVDPGGMRVADVGCGGGIYSLAWMQLGAADVTGVDFSLQMVGASRERAAAAGASETRLRFQQGEATATGLADTSVDIVFERALIHHLKDYAACFAEALRVLAPGGLYLVQDRTPEDVALPGTPEHMRGYFFERYPRLTQFEAGRRPASSTVEHALGAAGFTQVQAHSLWELRKTYASYDELARDLAARTGRSILHELTDAELQDLVAYIGDKLPKQGPVVEKDRWTLWAARKAT